MSKFRFKVWRNDYTVTMKIFEQPEETRGKVKLFQHEDIEVCSITSPELLDCVVFLRGNIKSRDHMAATISFDNLDKAEVYRKKITEALNAYAKHLEEQETPKCADKLVYQFDRIGIVVVATPINIPEWVIAKGRYVYENDEFGINCGPYWGIFSDSLVIPETGKTKHAETSADWFLSEKEASKWIKQATKAIAECNAKYATVAEPKARIISRETVIAE